MPYNGGYDMKASSILKLLPILACSLFLLNCASPKPRMVPVELVDMDEAVSQEGLAETAELQFVQRKTWAYLEVIEKSPNVKSVSRVTNNENDDVYFGFVDFSTVEDSIVYSMTEKAEEVIKLEKEKKPELLSEIYISNIWKQKVGSFAKSRLTYGRRVDIHPSFTRDGKKVIFSSDRSGKDRKIWMLNVDGGGGLRLITSTPAEDYSSYASKAEDMVAYASIPEGASEPQVWTIDLEGRLATQLREGMDPRISPDGKWIAFLKKENEYPCDEEDPSAGEHVYQIWKMTIEGDSETQLTMNEDYCVRDPMWSPNGKWIVYSSNENVDSNKRRNYDIWLMATDGTQRVQLTTNGSMDILPTFGRTGEYIYFVSNRGGKWNIWRFRPVFY
jgi:Tol biopolymer transport system component